MRWLFVAIFAVFVGPILLAAPTLGILSNPWSAFWLGARSVSTIVLDDHPVVDAVAAPVPTPAVVSASSRDVIAAALSWLGTPYLWSGCTPHGIDCSCLVRNVYLAIGVHLPRTTVEQWAATPRIDRSDLRPGDLVFFRDTCTGCGGNPTHIGLYLGSGKMVNAGDPVQINDVFAGFYNQHYMGAGRVLS